MIDPNEIAGWIGGCQDVRYLGFVLQAIAKKMNSLGVPVTVLFAGGLAANKKEQEQIRAATGIAPDIREHGCPPQASLI